MFSVAQPMPRSSSRARRFLFERQGSSDTKKPRPCLGACSNTLGKTARFPRGGRPREAGLPWKRNTMRTGNNRSRIDIEVRWTQPARNDCVVGGRIIAHVQVDNKGA